jgi:hypothetical protein
MFDGLFIASLIGTCVQAIKEHCEPVIPAENWANKELYHEDIMNGVPIEQRMNNLKNGKYKMSKTYVEPHRTKDGRILIENCKLYNEDVKNYGAYQAQQWVKQGKYNLEPEELKKEEEHIKAEMDYLFSLVNR